MNIKLRLFFKLYLSLSLVGQIFVHKNNLFYLPFMFAGEEEHFRLDKHPSPASTVGRMACVSI